MLSHFAMAVKTIHFKTLDRGYAPAYDEQDNLVKRFTTHLQEQHCL